MRDIKYLIYDFIDLLEDIYCALFRVDRGISPSGIKWKILH